MLKVPILHPKILDLEKKFYGSLGIPGSEKLIIIDLSTLRLSGLCVRALSLSLYSNLLSLVIIRDL